MKRKLKSLTVTIFTVGLLPFTTKSALPENWINAGNKPDSYTMKIDKSTYKSGNGSATIQSIDEKIDGFGTLMQTCSAIECLGKRIKMTGFVKSEDIMGWAGLWLRVDSKAGGRFLSFDNMENRPIKGTTDWKEYEIVLDVPENASTLNFGALLAGTGKLWFDDLKFEIVSDTTPSTEQAKLLKPSNLDFEN
jgi:hypothetical protein